MTEKSPLVITISRQMGSGGSYLGYLAAKELGFKYIDREILRQAAERLGTDPGVIEHLDEQAPSLMETIMKGFSFGFPEVSAPLPQERPVDHRDLFAMECRIMKEIADRFSAVIVGRAGFFALKDRERVVRIFLHAPLEFRARRIMKAQNLSDLREVLEMVKGSDQRRAKFIRDMAGVHWTDARNYHLCLDTSRIDFPVITGMIVKLTREKVG